MKNAAFSSQHQTETANKFMQRAMTLADEEKSISTIVKTYIEGAKLYHLLDQPDQSKALISKAMLWAKSDTKSQQNLARVASAQSNIYGIEYSERTIDSIRDPEMRSYAYRLCLEELANNGDFTGAGLMLAKVGDKNQIYSLTTLAAISYDSGMTDYAKKLDEQALRLIKSEDKSGLFTISLCGIAERQFRMGNYDSARSIYHSSLDRHPMTSMS